MKSWKKPTSEQVNALLKNLKGNLRPYFFSKLENPEWLEVLEKKRLLEPPIPVEDEEGNVRAVFWEASTYLIKVTPYKPDIIFTIIKPFLDDTLKGNQNVSSRVLQSVLQISMAFPDNKSNFSVEIGRACKTWLNRTGYVSDWLYIKEVTAFLQDLKRRGKSKLSLEILEAFLKLLPEITYIDNSGFGGKEKSKETKIKTKFLLAQRMDGYCYEELLKAGRDIFIPDHSFDFFNHLYYILKNLLEEEPELDQEIGFRRSAIENHEQGQYNTDPVYQLISAIRDAAENTIENDKNESKKIFIILKQHDAKVLTRIILHLLGKYPKDHKKTIAEYLTSEDYFYDEDMHHEYYLLLQQEFGNLSSENQKQILKYIKNGARGISSCKSEGEKQSYMRYWRFKKLYCIKDSLSGEWKKKYQAMVSKLDEPEHPEFLHYLSSGWFGNRSPKEAKELEEMHLNEVVTYLKNWKPTGNFRDATRAGLADILKKDMEKNPRKYLDDLLLFKEVSEPTYIRHIFQVLIKVKDKTSEDWNKIIDLGQWALNTQFPDSEKRDSFNDDPNWIWCHKELARLLTDGLRNKEKVEQELLITFADRVFKILKQLALQKDSNLEEENPNKGSDKYYQRAINSLHGEALVAIMEYSLWLGRHKQKEKAASDIAPVLDELLNNSTYLETWAVIGRYIPWLHLTSPKWIEGNLDKILPEDKRKKFNAAWLTYINFVNPYDEVLPLLQKKYVYVLKNHLYEDSEERDIDRRIGHHIAVYYASGKINIHNKIMKTLFETKENEKERTALFSYIGRSLEAEKTNISDQDIEKFQALWDWRRKGIRGCEKEHSIELKQFMWWYKSNRFEQPWAINQLHDIIIKYEIQPDWFLVYEQLLTDIEKYTDKVWEIVNKSIDKNYAFDSQLQEFVKKSVKYIKEYGNEDLKKDKDRLINELGDKFGVYAFEALEEFLE